jgi:hypothetical protein
MTLDTISIEKKCSLECNPDVIGCETIVKRDDSQTERTIKVNDFLKISFIIHINLNITIFHLDLHLLLQQELLQF